MRIIILLLTWNGGFKHYPADKPLDLCFVQRGMNRPSQAYWIFSDGSSKPLTCELVPEKKWTETKAAYWTAY